MKLHFLLLSGSGLAAFLATAWAGPSHAEETPLETGTDLETMIVTAHRVPLPQARVGSAVSVIDADLLRHRQSPFAADVLQDVPGVAVSRTAGYGSFTQVRVRGAESNQVLVLIDGVEANDPALDDEFDFAALQSYDIERIEVLRGPQSALWGSDATSGVINVRTRQGPDGFDSGAFAEYGTWSTYHGGGRASWNAPRGGLQINGAYFDTSGYSAASSGNENDGYRTGQLSASARYHPTTESSVRVFARYTDSRSEFDGTDFTTGFPADADNQSNDELLLLGTTGGVTLLDGAWDQSLRLTLLDSDHRQQSDGTGVASSGADKFGAYYQSDFELPDWAGISRQRVVLAVDYEKEEFRQRGEAFPGFDPNQNQSQNNTGYVLEYLALPVEHLDVSASIRFDDASDFEDVTTYRLTASYSFPARGTRLHASAGKSQKSPTFIERYGYYPDQFLGNPALEPEKNHGFDVGVEQNLFRGALRMDATWFSERLDDEIDPFAFDADSGLYTAANLSGQSRRDGLEVEAHARLPGDLTATASYTYTDSRSRDPSGGHTRELRRPRHMASANLNRPFAGSRGNLNANVSYTSAQRDRYFPPFPEAPELVTLSDYVLVNLAASFELTRRIVLQARAENVTDERYDNVFGYRSPGRAFYAGVRLKL